MWLPAETLPAAGERWAPAVGRWGKRIARWWPLRLAAVLCLVLSSLLVVPGQPAPKGEAAPAPAGSVDGIVAGIASFFSRTWRGTRVAAEAGPPNTHDNSPSTPWTAFAGSVNVVAGNTASQAADRVMPSVSVSVGFGTSTGRFYTSAASGRTPLFGQGTFTLTRTNRWAADPGMNRA